MSNKAIINVITNSLEFSDFTEQELTARQIVQEQDRARNVEQLAKKEAPSAAEEKLLALGLTTEDLKALLG